MFASLLSRFLDFGSLVSQGEEGVKRHQAGHSAGGNPMDIFSQFFGGGRQQQQERKTPNMVSEVLVDLQDVYVGKTFDVRHPILFRKQADLGVV